MAWPTPGVVPADGMYRVPTTWREVTHAAISVGRDPTAWLAAVPALAWSELIARRSPLAAYLGGSGGLGGYRVQPNVVYREGTESTAQAAFGYRIGMTMAEWACRGLMGLGPTTHAEAATPLAAGSGWSASVGLPDLVGVHRYDGMTWLVEAKGARKVARSALVKGAEQLSTPGLLDGPHMRVLCGTSLDHRLSMTIDVESVNPTVVPAGVSPALADSDDAVTLARAWMLIYLCLAALPPSSRSIRPVGPEVSDRDRRRSGATVVLLENDASTTREREEVRRQPDDRRHRRTSPHDMLTGAVPGTDLIVGMSRRLFAACQRLADAQRRIADDVDRERPRSPDAPEEMLNALREDRQRRYWQHEREDSRLSGDTREGFEAGAHTPWPELLGQETEIEVDAPAGFLEAATEDTYLAMDSRMNLTLPSP